MDEEWHQDKNLGASDTWANARYLERAHDELMKKQSNTDWSVFQSESNAKSNPTSSENIEASAALLVFAGIAAVAFFALAVAAIAVAIILPIAACYALARKNEFDGAGIDLCMAIVFGIGFYYIGGPRLGGTEPIYIYYISYLVGCGCFCSLTLHDIFTGEEMTVWNVLSGVAVGASYVGIIVLFLL